MQKMLLCLIVILFCFGTILAQSQPVNEESPLFISGVIGEDSREFVIYRYVNAEWELVHDGGSSKAFPSVSFS